MRDTCEQMVGVFPHLDSLGVEASGALAGVGLVLVPHCLDVFAAVGV